MKSSKKRSNDSDLRKRVHNLDKRISRLGNQIRAMAEQHRLAVRSGRPSLKTALNELLLQNQQLQKQRSEAQTALSEAARVAKKHTRGRGLYRQIMAVERKIKVQTANRERAKRENRFYDGAVLKKLKSEREALVNEYVRLKDPLGLLPSLTPPSQKKKGAPKKHEKKSAPEEPQEAIGKAKGTPAGASVKAEIVVKPKKKRKSREPRDTFAKKAERMNTYDPKRELEIWEKPQGAKRGRYIPPGA